MPEAAETYYAADLRQAPHEGDIDASLYLGFDGTSLSPTSLALAFGGWNELGGSVEVAILDLDDAVISVGLEGFYARPVFGELWIESHAEENVDVDMAIGGVLARGSVHLGSSGFAFPAQFDPYAMVVIGPTSGSFRVKWDDASSRVTEGGIRVGAGVGARWFGDQQWFVDGQLRYLVGFAFDHNDVLSPDEDHSWTRSRYQRQPRGFQWQIGVGRRF